VEKDGDVHHGLEVQRSGEQLNGFSEVNKPRMDIENGDRMVFASYCAYKSLDQI